MKTGQETLERALRLLGYTDSEGQLQPGHDKTVYRRAENAVRQIYDDLRRVDAQGSAEEDYDDLTLPVPLSPAAVTDALPYGVAMLVAQTEGDGDSQALFAALYAAKRASLPRRPRRRADVLPRGECV